MPAHSLAAARGVRTQISIEKFSSTRAPSLNELREEGLDTVSMPNERTCREMLIPQRMGPAGSIKSDQETIASPCSPAGHGTAPNHRPAVFTSRPRIAQLPSHNDAVWLRQ